mgnify:FL=1
MTGVQTCALPIYLIEKQLENTKKAVEEVNKQTKNYQSSLDEKRDLQRRHNIEIAQENTDASKKAADKRKQDNDKALKDQEEHNKQMLDANKSLQEQRRQIEEDIFLKNIKDEDERAKKKLEFDYLNQKKAIEQSKASEAEKNATLQDLYLQFITNREALDTAAKTKKDQQTDDDLAKMIEDLAKEAQIRADADLKKASDEDLSFQERYAAIQERENLINSITFESEAARTEFEKQNSEARKAISVAETNHRMKQLELLAKLATDFSNVIGEQTAAGKAAAIAATTINTYMSATAAFKGMVSNFPGPVGIALGVVAAGVSVAAGIANIKKIMAVKVPGKGGGGGGSVPSGGMSGGGISAPVTPQVAATTINQGQVNQLASATSRAFVLESDVSGNQERIQRLNRAARIS